MGSREDEKNTFLSKLWSGRSEPPEYELGSYLHNWDQHELPTDCKQGLSQHLMKPYLLAPATLFSGYSQARTH